MCLRILHIRCDVRSRSRELSCAALKSFWAYFMDIQHQMVQTKKRKEGKSRYCISGIWDCKRVSGCEFITLMNPNSKSEFKIQNLKQEIHNSKFKIYFHVVFGNGF